LEVALEISVLRADSGSSKGVDKPRSGREKMGLRRDSEVGKRMGRTFRRNL